MNTDQTKANNFQLFDIITSNISTSSEWMSEVLVTFIMPLSLIHKHIDGDFIEYNLSSLIKH